MAERLRGWPADVAVAVWLAVVAVYQLQTSGCACAHVPGGFAMAAALALVMTLPYSLRSRWPLWTLSVAAAAHLVGAALGFPPSTGGFVALLFGLYTVAVRYPIRISAVAALAIAAGTVYVLRQTGPLGVGFFVGFAAAAWAVGHDARTRHTLTELRDEQVRSAERARIARELHDVVAHSLSVMVVHAGAGRQLAIQEPAEAQASLALIEGTGREALVEMRRLLGVLRTEDEADRAPQPSLERLDVLLDRARQSGLKVELSVVGTSRRLPAAVELAAYRIAQEALTNCLKHAPKASVDVALRWAERLLELEIVDDGPGRETGGPVASGHGLPGMRERAALCGGRVEAGPRRQGGWRVAAWLPFDGGKAPA
ncbi:MAG: two-component sensor histidine kinase [Candidatus Nephthysia bennettiae]|uniref:histidine kinase n=1 Tax=Candidatus Nephthysia bennettiae TaxID=3127016 RepID=A0A934K0U3_9BACT|nr:sensor histidine kinase [Candidatus Dormibacteraeota bacterium]MBJ7611497.1 sensor histidine kinase [Candidatus Dormibacteraeota bacterium]PZR99291.1 MAG: two-component sensor histidine kinase [Candidatus Dormibacteraeota bacterium]